MLLERLTVCDFGLFRGQHVFDLAPRRKYGAQRPIILVGGLNGSGKTTILTAVRTALYGRQALGFGTTNKAYEEFVSDHIHRNRNSLVPTNAASVSLDFHYSQLGRQSRYRVTRSWSSHGKRIEESLRVYRDEKLLDDLTQEQAQAFLNQLIPIGVSELFFFDGEKIARLASDTGEAALSSSIRRLLGLDIVDKLKADLTIYSRQQRAKSLSESDSVELRSLEQQLEETKKDADNALILLRDEVIPAIDRAQRDLDALEAVFREIGGAWAVSKDSIKARTDELLERRKSLSADIRELLNGAYPLALGHRLSEEVVVELRAEQEIVAEQALRRKIKSEVGSLKREVQRALSKMEFRKIEAIIEKRLGQFSGPAKNAEKRLHKLGDQDAETVMAVFTRDAPDAEATAKKLASELGQVEGELSELSTKLSQAPVDEALVEEMERLKLKSIEIGELQEKKRQLLELVRSKLWAAIDINRKLRAAEERLTSRDEAGAIVKRAAATTALLDEFTTLVTKRKVAVLRQHFTSVFSRLARKEDLVVDAVIDDATFEVALVGKDGVRIPKQSLSAGEKQVYAIAMLEALAKTSGRSLPIIIDTPLGRLDSEHRSKLVNHYFPQASHQVVILSTDTEVDENFYGDLSSSISHAFHLRFNGTEGMTTIEEGYFWKHQDQELRNVS